MPAWNIKRKFVLTLLCIVLVLSALPTVAQTRDRGGGQNCLTNCAPRLGIISAFGSEADILLSETTRRRSYKINGNVFTTGFLRGNRVVIVLTGVSIPNAAMITQLMLDHFNIHHLLLSGIAGGVDPTYNIGDVVIAETWAFPFEVYWNGNSHIPSPCEQPGDLSCLGLQISSTTNTANSDYQIPSSGGVVGTGLFMRDTFVRNQSNFPDGEYTFDYAADPEMLAVARSIRPQLDQCGPTNSALCVSVQPVVRYGGRGVSGPVFLANLSYRDYLTKTLQAVSVDMETTALAHVAYANEIPFIAFRSLSDLAGGDDFEDVGAFFGSGLAESNAAKMTLGFLRAWDRRRPA